MPIRETDQGHGTTGGGGRSGVRRFRFLAVGVAVAAMGAGTAPAADALVWCGCSVADPPITYVRTVPDPGGQEIFRMNADGSGQARVTTAAGFDSFPSWSPGHTRIVYATTRHSAMNVENFELHVIDSDGRNDRRLTDSPGADTEPAWSPTSDKIAFASTRDGNGEIYVINPDGSGLQNLTRFHAADSQPAWSADGTRLAFIRRTIDGLHIFTMNADGSGVRQVTFGSGTRKNPAWSPDGSTIAFSMLVNSNEDVYVVPTNGPALSDRVTFRPGVDQHPTWSPDGRIAYSSGGNIRVVRPDGSGDAALTTSSDFEFRPQWARVRQPVLSP